MARVIVTTLERSELARVQRIIEHKSQAEQLERFIANAGNFVFRTQLLQLADQELDAANPPYIAFLAKYGLTTTDGSDIDLATGIISREGPDDTNSEPGNVDNTDAAVQGEKLDGQSA